MLYEKGVLYSGKFEKHKVKQSGTLFVVVVFNCKTSKTLYYAICIVNPPKKHTVCNILHVYLTTGLVFFKGHFAGFYFHQVHFGEC